MGQGFDPNNPNKPQPQGWQPGAVPGLPPQQQQPGMAPQQQQPGMAPQQQQPGMAPPQQQPGMAPPQQQPGMLPQQPPPPADGALGFQAPPKEEKYNTQYLMANLSHERRTTQFIILGVLVAALGGAALWFAIAPGGAPPKEVAADAAADPPAAKAPAEPSGADKKREGKQEK